MSKWKKLYGKDYPEVTKSANELIADEITEDIVKSLYISDLPEFNHDMLKLICVSLKIDIKHLYNRHERTKREQYERHGFKP